MFTLGNKNLFVGTDHKPLVPIMGVKNLEDIKNPRLRKFKDKTLRFSLETRHIPGKHLSIEDSVSWYPVSAAEDDNEMLEETLSSVQYRM